MTNTLPTTIKKQQASKQKTKKNTVPQNKKNAESEKNKRNRDLAIELTKDECVKEAWQAELKKQKAEFCRQGKISMEKKDKQLEEKIRELQHENVILNQTVQDLRDNINQYDSNIAEKIVNQMATIGPVSCLEQSQTAVFAKNKRITKAQIQQKEFESLRLEYTNKEIFKVVEGLRAVLREYDFDKAEYIINRLQGITDPACRLKQTSVNNLVMDKETSIPSDIETSTETSPSLTEQSNDDSPSLSMQSQELNKYVSDSITRGNKINAELIKNKRKRELDIELTNEEQQVKPRLPAKSTIRKRRMVLKDRQREIDIQILQSENVALIQTMEDLSKSLQYYDPSMAKDLINLMHTNMIGTLSCLSQTQTAVSAGNKKRTKAQTQQKDDEILRLQYVNKVILKTTEELSEILLQYNQGIENDITNISLFDSSPILDISPHSVSDFLFPPNPFSKRVVSTQPCSFELSISNWKSEKLPTYTQVIPGTHSFFWRDILNDLGITEEPSAEEQDASSNELPLSHEVRGRGGYQA